MQQEGNPIKAEEQLFQEGIYNACVDEAPKLKEKIDMAIAMQLVKMRYEEITLSHMWCVPPKKVFECT